MAPRSERPLFFAIRVAIGILFVVILMRSEMLDWSRLRALADPRVSGVAVALLLATLVATSWRLCVLIRPVGFDLPLVASIRLTLLGMLFNAVLPGGASGDLVRIYYATAENHGRRTEIAAIMAFDRGIGMFALLAWPVLAAPFFPGMLAASSVIRILLLLLAFAAGCVALGLAATLSRRITGSRFAVWLFGRPRIGGHMARIASALQVYRNRPGTLIGALGVAFLAHTLFISATLALASGVSPGGMSWSMAVLVPLGFLANALPVTPGGLGVGEAALEGVFRLAGLSGGAELMISWRLLGLLLALGGLPIYLRGQRRLVRSLGEMPAQQAADETTLSRRGVH